MEDTIEVCARCGKMPRMVEQEKGFFVCSRCGNKELISLKADEYERVVAELDRNYQEALSKQRIEVVAKEMPIGSFLAPKKSKPSSGIKATAKKKTKKGTSMKKPMAKKATPKKKDKKR